ncbi:uncharacterized protein B0J16DRAFT_371584 [Fusarium flagelliforme]|uniref:CBM-cenC domain-containing protein n=1 Tax=Fusarium flagelliforme TaxID=2675880 RepID=A0A395N558_9HYPO|nr:uncharacterized protein B0J16DRAFT_371584 [Fusarium flagelliforme]KAH7184648.1 hypothetical protein B0J16DRAFT_371584 [Fusarium flagelliforme]RFN54923.1 hypothetical protein FIE12Z_770 [Fusarium flagelliforme]
MKLNFSALQLLALCQVATASPCKPPGSSVTTGSTTADITTQGSTATESVTISETSLFSSSTADTETEVEAAATTTTEIMATSASAPTFEAITASDTGTVLTGSIAISEATSEVTSTSEATVNTSFETEVETEATSTARITTSEGATTTEAVTTVSATVPFESETETETMMTESITTSQTISTSDIPLIPTTSAEPTTTTSSLTQKPTNVLHNPSFEEATISPWTPIGSSNVPSLSTSESWTGAQSVRFAIRRSVSIFGRIQQQIDPSLLEADRIYDFTVYTKASIESACASRIITCYSGTQQVEKVGETIDSATNPGIWQPLKASCTWSQAQLDAGVFIRIWFASSCLDMDWFVDDATLVKVD